MVAVLLASATAPRRASLVAVARSSGESSVIMLDTCKQKGELNSVSDSLSDQGNVTEMYTECVQAHQRRQHIRSHTLQQNAPNPQQPG